MTTASDIAKETADFIKAARTAARLPRWKAAELVGMSERTLQRIERADSSVRLSTLVRLCNALGLQLVVRVTTK